MASPEGLTGLTGVAADVIESLGTVGVGLLTLLETVFPPIPSEVVLPLAGFLAAQGHMSLVGAFVAATVGSVAGALILYWLGRRLGEDRAATLVARLPLVDRRDVDRAAAWFHRHGRSAVFVGRLIPGVRSMISLPAGAARMPALRFAGYTAAGSALWNGPLIGAGVGLGSSWDRVEQYAGVLDWIVIGGLVVVIALAIHRRIRRRH